MANTLKHKQSSVAGKAPTTTDLALGELAINTTDGKVYLKKNVSGTESIVEVTAGGGNLTVTNTAVDKTIEANEACFVTASGKTITLPASPSAGDQVIVGVNNFSDTVISRNGKNIMSLAENMTIDKPNVSVGLIYVDITIGWKLI